MTTQAPTPPADPTAVIGRRTAGYVIDALIAIVLFIVVFAIIASSDERLSSFEAERICDTLNDNDTGYFCFSADSTVILVENSGFATLLLITGIYFVATQLILPSLTGFTPGKAIVGLRIVNQETFEKAGFGSNLVRWLLWIVDSAPWCFPLVALITGLSSNGHRRVGDMAANTVVIDKLWVGKPMAIAGVNSVAPAASGAVAAPPFMPPAPTAPAAGSPLAVSAPPIAPPTAPPPMPPAPGTTSTPPPPPPGATPPPPVPMVAPAPFSSEPQPEPETKPETDADADVDATAAINDDTAAVAPIAPPAAPPAPAPPAPAPPPVAPPAPVSQPGVEAPQWDAARDTYIQWDPDLAEWMEWNESAGAWIPISQ